jgi:hypothetical protein
MTVGVLSVRVMTVGVLSVGVMTVGVLSVGVMTVGVLSVGVMTRSNDCRSNNIIPILYGTISIGITLSLYYMVLLVLT